MSRAGGKKARSKARAAQDFELNPPRCMNCENYSPQKHGAPETEHWGKVEYERAKCRLGGFIVKTWSICNLWVGRNGEKLERV